MLDIMNLAKPEEMTGEKFNCKISEVNILPKQEVEKNIKEIQVALFRLIPEKWEKLYLYASVLGEEEKCFFFTISPKTILKPKPINCYEVAQNSE